MKPTSRGIPEVFIIESMHKDQEKEERFDGRALYTILNLHHRRSPCYCYFRTKRELKKMAKLFQQSDYRYLHVSCHGDETGLELRRGTVSFAEFADIFKGCLEDRRLFVSACNVGVKEFAAEVFLKNPKCYSVVAPKHGPGISESAIFWSAFYFLMRRENWEVMKREKINRMLSDLGRLFPPKMSFFRWDNRSGNVQAL